MTPSDAIVYNRYGALTRLAAGTLRVLLAVLLGAASLQAGTTGILEGTVVDRETGEPLIGVSVTIIGTNLGDATNADGYFTVANVEAGIYDVRITNIGYQQVNYRGVTIRPDL